MKVSAFSVDRRRKLLAEPPVLASLLVQVRAPVLDNMMVTVCVCICVCVFNQYT